MHFQTDIWSSAVVIVGLLAAKFGFAAADAIAALGVSVVVVWVSIQLGRRTVDALLDSAPAGLEERILEDCRERSRRAKLSQSAVPLFGPGAVHRSARARERRADAGRGARC